MVRAFEAVNKATRENHVQGVKFDYDDTIVLTVHGIRRLTYLEKPPRKSGPPGC